MPFIPLDDDNPNLLIERPWITWGMMAACLLMFWVQSLSGERGGLTLIYGLGVIPSTLIGQVTLSPDLYLVPPAVTLVSYAFLHGSLLHLIGNMLFLWVFGDNIEDSMGHLRFLAFYLLCGAVAALGQAALFPDSQVPLIGASGAVSGVLGAYLLLHPGARILIPILYIPVRLPAWLLLLGWVGFQLFAATNRELNTGDAGVAWWAHIAGFLAGLILIVLFRYKSVPLFGRGDLPRGITLHDRAVWEHRRHPGKPEGKRGGPWG